MGDALQHLEGVALLLLASGLSRVFVIRQVSWQSIPYRVAVAALEHQSKSQVQVGLRTCLVQRAEACLLPLSPRFQHGHQLFAMIALGTRVVESPRLEQVLRRIQAWAVVVDLSLLSNCRCRTRTESHCHLGMGLHPIDHCKIDQKVLVTFPIIYYYVAGPFLCT